jgi:hypothetical protein
LVCRNIFLQKNSASANIGNNKTICIHIKLEVKEIVIFITEV